MKSLMNGEGFEKGIVDKFDCKDLRKKAINIFKMKDNKVVNKVKIEVTEETVTQADNIRYIKHILKSFSGGIIKKGKRKVIKVNKKCTDATPYLFVPCNLVCTLFKLQHKNPAKNAQISEYIKI